MQSIAEKSYYLPYIDGLRGIAVLMILLVHTSQRVGNEFIGSFTIGTLEQFTNSGARGVQLFFILSAFTLFSSSYARSHSEKYPKIDFYLRRAFRIWPFWIFMVVYMAYTTGVIYDIPRILNNIFFTFGFVRFKPDVELVVGGWAIFTEVTFYLFLPFLFIYINNVYKSFKLFLIMLFVAVAWVVFAPKVGVPSTGAFIFLFPLTWWYTFTLGIILFFLVTNENFKVLVLNNVKNWLILDVMALLAIITLIRGNAIFAVFSFVFLFIASVPEKTIIGSITRNPLLMRFGVYCYSIYLFQFPLLDALDPVKNMLFSNIGIIDSPVEIKLLVWFPIVALISLGVAFFTFNLIEKPCIVYGKKFISKINIALDSSLHEGIINKLKKGN
jgi:peptidoglycan/LPS O-acetylase OafA/YrhL